MTETLAAGRQTQSDAVPAIRLRKLTKVFGDTVAVNDAGPGHPPG